MKVKYLLVLLFVLVTPSLLAQDPFEEYFKDYFNTGDVTTVIKKGMVQMQGIAWIIAVVVFLLSFGFGYLQSGVAALLGRENSGGGFFKADNLFYSLFILILLGAYSPIASTLETSINYINSISKVDSKDIANIANETTFKDQQIRSAIWAANQNDNQELKKKGIIILDKLGVNEDEFMANEDKFSSSLIDERPWYEKAAYFLDFRNWPTIIFGAMGQLIMGIIRGVVLMFTYFYFKLLFLLGPFAFAFAVNKRFQDLITDWLGAVLSTGLVFTTMNIIDYMYSAIMKNRMAEHNINVDMGAQSAFEIVFNLGFIVLYLSAFKLTKTFVPGKGLGAAMVGKTIALGAAAVGGAAIAAGGAVGGAKGAAAVKNLADATSKAGSAYHRNES